MKQVTLKIQDEHYRMIERCAKLEEKSVEQWLLKATEATCEVLRMTFSTS